MDPYYAVVESLAKFLSQLCGKQYLHDKLGYLVKEMSEQSIVYAT